MDQEKLVETITAEVLRRLEKKHPVLNTAKILAVITGGMIGLQEGLEQLKKIKELGNSISVVLSPAAEKIAGLDRIQECLGVDSQVITAQDEYPGNLLKEADFVLVPVLTQNTAAKVANTLADTLASTLIMQALLRGKPVLAAKNAADPKDALRLQADMGHETPGLAQALQANLKKLEVYGVTLVPVQNLAEECQKLLHSTKTAVLPSIETKKGIVDAQAVKAAAEKGVTSLFITPGTIVTPLARDMARDYHVTLSS